MSKNMRDFRKGQKTLKKGGKNALFKPKTPSKID
jgi:hypothetical protein